MADGVVRKRKRYRRINVEAARRGRARGLSYAEIARMLRVTPQGVYYALNKKAREPGPGASGKPRCVYVPDEVWDAVKEEAEGQGISASRFVVAALREVLELGEGS